MNSIVFEIVPPPLNWQKNKISDYCLDVANALQTENIDLVVIPEVINEHREGQRKSDFVTKMDNIHFSDILKGYLPKLEIVLFKISVRLPKNEFEAWLDIINQKNIRYVVIVGGESEEIDYPGYSVGDAIEYIRKHYPDIQVGAITIFTRPAEAERIITKIKAGATFFFSQIIFEAANMKQVVINLNRLCKADKIPLPKIYLSLALASKRRDIEFMKWLGVEFPSAVFDHLISDNEQELAQLSLDVIDTTLDEILHFSEKEQIDLGFNIEHVMFNNLHLSTLLCKKIKQRLAI